MADAERLRTLFANPELGWLVDRLRQRAERGQGFGGSVGLKSPTAAQRDAIDRLLGRAPSRSDGLTVDLARLERVLQQGRLCESLAEAIEAVLGIVVDRRAARAAESAGWRQLLAGYADRFAGCAQRLDWLDALARSGLLRRLARRNLNTAAALLEQSCVVLAALPAQGLSVAELAARAIGDSHALDHGRPLTNLVLRALTTEPCDTVEARRDAWAGAGVLLDELSAPVLVLNLSADPQTPTGRALCIHAEAGEPYRLSTRQLLRNPPRFVRDGATAAADRTVYVCENPTVVAVAANRLGPRCKPLVCVEGQPKTAATLLLSQLGAAGWRLSYHGDFDWPGLQIANLLHQRHQVSPWRFGAADYGRIAGGCALSGNPVAAVWDAKLMPAMAAAGRAIHEEAVLDDLLSDLDRGGP